MQPDGQRILLRDAHVGARRCDVEVQGGRIVSVLGVGQAGTRGATTVDLDGRLVLPGFVNAHAHIDKALLHRTAGAETRFEDGVMKAPMAEAKTEFTVDSVKERARRVLDKAIATGTVAMRTHVDIDEYAGLTGLRAVGELREEYRDRIDLQVVAFPQEGLGSEASITLMREALESGADLVGGKPSADPDLERHLDIVLDLAVEYGRDLDVHLDVNMDVEFAATRAWNGHRYPAELEVAYLGIQALERRFPGRITASHLMALDSVPGTERAPVIDLLREVGSGVIVCPSCSLYLHGRNDYTGVRRGVAPVRELQASGVPVAFAPDNVGDAFNLYSGPDMLLHAVLTAYTCHMQTIEDLDTVIAMGTEVPAALMGLERYGLDVGCWADVVVVDCATVYDAIVDMPPRFAVLKRGMSVGPACGLDR